MVRYYAIAAVIVLTIAVIATMRAGEWMHFHFRSSNRPQPEQHVSESDVGSTPAAGLTGDAPWALSALPDCFMQQSESTGDRAYVDAHVPADAKEVPPGTRLSFGPCTIFVGNGELNVNRGADRFRIPPHAVLYRDGATLLLLRTTASASVLRTYTITATP
jgi:hypothetical protein